MTWKKFIVRDWPIILCFIGLALVITFISCKRGVLKSPTFVKLGEYNTKHPGNPILAFKRVKGKDNYVFDLNKPWTPKTGNWFYVYLCEDNIKYEKTWGGWWIFTMQEGQAVSAEKNREHEYFDLFFLGPKYQNVDYVKIILPDRYERYLPYTFVSLIIVYAGLWFVRAIVRSIQAMRRPK